GRPGKWHRRRTARRRRPCRTAGGSSRRAPPARGRPDASGRPGGRWRRSTLGTGGSRSVAWGLTGVADPSLGRRPRRPRFPRSRRGRVGGRTPGTARAPGPGRPADGLAAPPPGTGGSGRPPAGAFRGGPGAFAGATLGRGLPGEAVAVAVEVGVPEDHHRH